MIAGHRSSITQSHNFSTKCPRHRLTRKFCVLFFFFSFFPPQFAILILPAVFLCLAGAERTSENAAKGKREAPMAEPSPEFLPPRLEAPYATYSPVQLQSLGESGQQQSSFYHSNAYNTPIGGAPSYGSEFGNYGGDESLSALEQIGNDIGNENGNGNGLGQTVSNFNDAYNYGHLNNAANAYGNSASHLSTFNRLSQSNNIYNSNNENPNHNRFSGFKNRPQNQFTPTSSRYNDPYYGNAAFVNPNEFNGRFPSNPTHSSLISNGPPSYAAGVKGLGHFTHPTSSLHTHPLKNSRPIALTSANLRKPSSFGSDANGQNSFRPSYFLGSSFEPSNDFNQPQPQLTSLGTGNQYHSPQAQYLTSQPQEFNLQQDISNFGAKYQTSASFITKPQATAYGVPETYIYTRNEPRASVFRVPFGRS